MILKRQHFAQGWVSDNNGDNRREMDQQHFSSLDGGVLLCISGSYPLSDFVDIDVKTHTPEQTEQKQ